MSLKNQMTSVQFLVYLHFDLPKGDFEVSKDMEDQAIVCLCIPFFMTLFHSKKML